MDALTRNAQMMDYLTAAFCIFITVIVIVGAGIIGMLIELIRGDDV